MRILVTGTTKNQATRKFYLRQQLKVIPSHTSLVDCLTDMGHEVEHRPIAWMENLSKYDEVIIYFASPGNMSSCYLYSCLWALAMRPDAIIAYDDWQIDSSHLSIINMTKGPETLYHKFCAEHFFAANPDLGYSDLKVEAGLLKEGIGRLAAGNNRLLISMFRGGDKYKIFDKCKYDMDRIFGYNPNPYHFNRRPGDLWSEGENKRQTLFPKMEYLIPENKLREFNFCSLVQSNTSKWLKNQWIRSWPVNMYGSRSESQPRYLEGNMCEIFANQWGCLMPGYYNSGCGWWRARPLQVADAQSILIGDKKELMV